MKPSDGATQTGNNVEMMITQTGSTLSATIKKGNDIGCVATVNIDNNGRDELAIAWFIKDTIFIRVNGVQQNRRGCGTGLILTTQ